MKSADSAKGSARSEAFGALVRLLPGAAALLDRDLRYLAHSESWPQSYRLPDRDLVGRRHYEVFPEIDEEWKAIHRRCLLGETLRRESDAFPRADGRTDYVRWTVAPWREENGEIGGLLMFTEVLTDRVAMERRLAEREDFVRMLFERSPLGLNLCRLDGLWIESNPAFLEMIGYTREEADGGLTYWDLTPPRYAADEQRQLDSLEQTGRYGPYEKEFIRKDGSLVPVRLNGFFVEREGERYIWSLIEDMSELKRLERDVEEQRLHAIQASKLAMLGEMAAGFAHEINNPLAIIDGWAGTLAELARSGPAEAVEEAAGAINDAVRRATRIVSGLRKFAREDDGADLESVPVTHLVGEALQLCEARLRHHGVELRLQLDSTRRVRCASIEFTQVLLNLVNNAFDAVRDASERWIAISATDEGPSVVLRVRDSGPGVAPDDAERIFHPFFTTKRAGEGTGLGLPISKGIIERLGGSLAFDADDPHTCFSIRLPAVVGP